MLSDTLLHHVQHILRILQDGQAHSGQSLGKTLGISRTAIWKIIQTMQNTCQLPIETLPQKGYQLSHPHIPLEAGAITRKLHPNLCKQLNQITCLQQTESTSKLLFDQIQVDQAHHHLCLAEMQHAGIGRRGQTWQSPYGYNLYLSLLWSFDQPSHTLSGLSVLLAIITAEALQKIGLGPKLNLKWPNDVFYDNSKLAGILVETRSQQDGLTHCVMSLGLNGWLPDTIKQQIDQSATDYLTITGKVLDRNAFVAEWLNVLIPALTIFQQEGLTPFLARWQVLDQYFEKPIAIKRPQHTLTGTGLGITEQGLLKVATADHQVITLHSHEASIIRKHS